MKSQFHLKATPVAYGSQRVNTILALECIPFSFKVGTIIPFGSLSSRSYRGITLTSVLAKSYEFIVLDRSLPTLSENNIPQLTQTA